MSAPNLSRHHAMTLLFLHIPENNLRNTLSLISRWYIYLSQKAGHKDFVFKKRRFLVQDTRKFDCKAQIKMREILFFAEHKVVLVMYQQNESVLINQICGMTLQNSCYVVTFLTEMTIHERWSRSQLFTTLRAVWGFFSLSETLVWSNKANTLPAPGCLFIHITWINFKTEKLSWSSGKS